MIFNYVFINFFISIFLFCLVIYLFKRMFSIDKYIFSDMDFMSLSKIIGRRVAILFIFAIVSLFLSMIPLRVFLDASWLNYLPFEYRVHIYLINSYMALNILFFSFYKLISYEKKKRQYMEGTSFNDFDFDINMVREKALAFGKLNGTKLFIGKTVLKTFEKKIITAVFIVITSTLLVFFIMIIFDSSFWSSLNINNINGIPYVIYAFGMLVFMDLFFIALFFVKIYIDLEKRIVAKSIFGMKIKAVEIKRSEVKLRGLYYKGIYIGMYIYFYNNFYGEFPIIITKDKDKAVEMLEFLSLITNKSYRIV